MNNLLAEHKVFFFKKYKYKMFCLQTARNSDVIFGSLFTFLFEIIVVRDYLKFHH